jgi:hypothetical protein
MKTSGTAKPVHPEWLIKLAESQGFLLEALEANRAGHCTNAQLRLLEARGRGAVKEKRRPLFGLLGIGVFGFLATAALSSPLAWACWLSMWLMGRTTCISRAFPDLPAPGVEMGPSKSVLTTMSFISAAALVTGILMLRSAGRWRRRLQDGLEQNRLASVEGQVILEHESAFEWTSDPFSVPSSANYTYVVQGLRFQILPQHWYAFQGPWATLRFRVYYMPGCNWIVNMEPA